MNLFVIRM